MDETFQRASVAGITKPYIHSLIVPDGGKCEAFKIYLKVRKEYVVTYVLVTILST